MRRNQNRLSVPFLQRKISRTHFKNFFLRLKQKSATSFWSQIDFWCLSTLRVVRTASALYQLCTPKLTNGKLIYTFIPQLPNTIILSFRKTI